MIRDSNSGGRRRLAAAWVTGVILCSALFVLGAWVSAWLVSSDLHQAARRDVETALALSAPDAALEPLRRRLRVPPALRDKDEAIVHYLLAARSVDEGRKNGANYFLALHFLNRDCSVAKIYLGEQLRLNAADPHVQRLADTIRTGGCGAAAKELDAQRAAAGKE